MELRNLQFKPGIYADDTDRDVGKLGFWKACDKVRFRDGMPVPIGGWVKDVAAIPFDGVCRAVADIRTYRSEVFIIVGTHLRLYVYQGGLYYNITPYRETGTLTDPFETFSGSQTVRVTDSSHGVAVGDYVSFSGATAVGGITVDGEYAVATVPTSNTYTITHTSPAASDAVGGGTVTYAYEIPVGLEDSVADLGWGAGTWGSEGWGVPRSFGDVLTQARTWTMEQWGEDVIASPRGGGIYVWDSSSGVSTRATRISQAPVTCRAVMVSPEDRHLIALGAHDGVSDNPMKVRWCDQEDYTDWTPSLTNTAGDKQLDSGNEILCGMKVRGEYLIFTDSSIFAMSFVGPPDTFGFRPLGDNGGLAGPNAVHVFEGVAYWMGEKDFFVYDGVTKVIPCTVNTYVFDDFNAQQKTKVYSGVNRKFREVWWLYPSGSSDECDRYVIYNMLEQSWVYGTLSRTAYVGDSDVIVDTYAFSPDGYLYTHESGTSDDGAALHAYVESGDVEVDQAGNQMMHVSKFIPDIKDQSGTVQLTITAKKYPHASETQTSGPHNITSTTNFVNPRVRGRQMSLKFESNATDATWRLGTPRVELVPHGSR